MKTTFVYSANDGFSWNLFQIYVLKSNVISLNIQSTCFKSKQQRKTLAINFINFNSIEIEILLNKIEFKIK